MENLYTRPVQGIGGSGWCNNKEGSSIFGRQIITIELWIMVV